MNNRRKKSTSLWFIFIIIFSFSGCFIVKKFAGADINALQFEKARESKMLEIRSSSALELAKRLSKNEPVDNADVTFYLGQSLLNKIAHQYDSTKGWLDQATSFIIKGVNLILNNGSAIASLDMIAHNEKHNVDVDLTMDCIMAIEMINNELVLKLEPFNIIPNVTAHGIIASAEEIISNLIKINLGDLSKNFPPLKIPVTFSNQLILQASQVNVQDKINLQIISPQTQIDYKLKLKEVLIFEGRAFVALNLENMEVK